MVSLDIKWPKKEKSFMYLGTRNTVIGNNKQGSCPHKAYNLIREVDIKSHPKVFSWKL